MFCNHTTTFGCSRILVSTLLLAWSTAGCGDGGSGRASAGGSASSDTATGSAGTATGSGTSGGTGSGTSGTTGATSSTSGTTSGASGTVGTGGTGASSGGSGSGASSTGGAGTTGGGASSGTGGCVPVSDQELVCDDVDDDCNGLVDDVDANMDGFCDCLSIGILGAPGSNPSANFQQWLMDQGTNVQRFGDTPAYVLTLADLQPYDIIIIDNLQKVFTDPERQAFQTWLDGGGSFMSMAGYVNTTSDRDEQNSLVSVTGITYVGNSVLLEPQTTWAPHPITANLGTVRFLGGWVVSGPGDTVMHVTGDPNQRLGVALDTGTYRAFVYGDEWVSFDSEWAAYPSVPVFWENALKWLSPVGFCLSPQ